MCLCVFSAPAFSHRKVTDTSAMSQAKLRYSNFLLPTHFPPCPLLSSLLPSTLLPQPVSALDLAPLGMGFSSPSQLNQGQLNKLKLLIKGQVHACSSTRKNLGRDWREEVTRWGRAGSQLTLCCKQLLDQLSPIQSFHYSQHWTLLTASEH